MLKNAPFYAGFAVDDLEKAKEFYGDVLGIFDVADVSTDRRIASPETLSLRAANGYAVLVHRKDDHTPAAHTILDFSVDDIEAVVDDLTEAGVVFERYDSGPLETDEKGIATPGPHRRVWFKDPAATSCRWSRNDVVPAFVA